jgi:hypothetical protein
MKKYRLLIIPLACFMHILGSRVLLLALFYWLLRAGPVSAQLPLQAVPVYAHYYSSNSSLPADLVYRIHADQNGYLWLLTDRGLVRYNGKEFRLIKTGRAEDFVSSCMAENNRLWLFAYSGHTAGIDLNTQKIIATDSLYGLNRLKTAEKLFLVGIRSGRQLSLYGKGLRGVVKVDLVTKQIEWVTRSSEALATDLLEQYRFPQEWKQQLQPELAKALRQNCSGFLAKDSFITIGNKIFIVDTNRAARLYFNGSDYGINDVVMGFERRGGDLFLGGMQRTGLYRIRGYFSDHRQQQRVERLLPEEIVTCVAKDYLGNIWVGTHGNGLFLFPGEEDNVLHYDKTVSGLYSDEVSSVREFPGGITAIGYATASADFYSGSRHKPLRCQVATCHDFSAVSQTILMPWGWLLFTRNEVFISAAQQNTLPGSFRRAIVEERGVHPGYKQGMQLGDVMYYVTGNTLVTIDKSGIIRRHAAANFVMAKRTCLLPLSAHDLYIGTVKGCYRNEKQLPYLQDVQVNAIDTVGGQLLWATNTGVYAVPIQQSGERHRLRQVAAAPCTALQHDHAFTYLHCADELIVLDNRNLRQVARVSGRDYAQPFRLNSFYPGSNYLILASNKGLFYIPKERFLSPETRAWAKIHVLCSLNGYAPADSAYTCSYQDGLSVFFELDILNYKREKHQISCLILKDGKELYREDDLGEDERIALQPAGPGNYSIKYYVRTGQDHVRVSSYALTVKPLWYQQWWCFPLLILLAWVVLAWVLYRILNLSAIRQRRRLEQRIYMHELEAQSLLGQLKPHFIFNVLMPLQGFFMRGEKLKGLDYLDHFSGLMRGMLRSIRHRYTRLSDEIAFLEQYLQVQQVRFRHCFVYHIHIDPELDTATCYIPSLLLQPLVENAIEHGIIKNRNEGRLTLSFKPLGNTLEITITDNGKGLPEDWTIRQDHALAIISERVQLLRKTKGIGSFSVVNNTDGSGGATAQLILAKDNRI